MPRNGYKPSGLIFAIVKLRVNDEGSNGAGCFEIKIWTDASKMTNISVRPKSQKVGRQPDIQEDIA